MAVKNLYSLGLLRNGKVYPSKQLAYQAFEQGTNDGVAKLARYLDNSLGGDPIIRTLVGFYANAEEMTDNGGGQSHYTILDIEGSAGEVEELKEAISAINETIGDGISGTTLTDAINDINDRIGSGFSENFTVADALAALAEELKDELEIHLDVAGEPTSGYLKTYILSQGNGTGATEIGRIDIPKDLVVTSGSLVHGTWSGDTFTEDPEGPDTAIKLVIANQEEPVYINTKDLVDYYTAGNGIDIDNTHNTISIKYNTDSEEFLVVDEDGIRVEGIQAAIDKKADEERLEASDGISIASNKVKAVAAGYSAPAIKNPITVDKDGIKFANVLDCGFFDDETVVTSTAEEINAIANPSETDVFIDGDGALNALTTPKRFNNIEVNDVDANQQIYLYANESINVDGMEVTGTKGSTNGYVLYSAPSINISNLSIANGSTAYNVFEGDQTNQNLKSLNAQYVTVDNPSLTHNVFNVYKPKDDCVINISDSKFNLTVDNSNVLRLANTANATGVTVNFENVEWTYENGLTSNEWGWAGLIIYQPYGTDVALSGDLNAMKTWTFNFKNCKYNGVKVTENNFGNENHNQVFYMHKVGGVTLADPVAGGLTLNFA
jgi:hypothetical protein